MIKTITSLTNPAVQHAVKLHHAKYRTQYKEFIAQGERVVETLVQADFLPRFVFITENMITAAQKHFSDDKLILVSDALMKKISTTETPSGIVAVFAIPQPLSYDAITSGVVFVEVQNPGNVGTLIRTAVAMNKKTAIFINSVDPWNPKVVQASAGTIGHIHIFQCSWETMMAHKKELSLCALVVKNGTKPEQAQLSNALIVIGNEARGLSTEKSEQCDARITLDMPGDCESLNAAIAGSIALYLSAHPSIHPTTLKLRRALRTNGRKK